MAGMQLLKSMKTALVRETADALKSCQAKASKATMQKPRAATLAPHAAPAGSGDLAGQA